MGNLGLDLLNAKLELFCRVWIDNLAPAYKDINLLADKEFLCIAAGNFGILHFH